MQFSTTDSICGVLFYFIFFLSLAPEGNLLVFPQIKWARPAEIPSLGALHSCHANPSFASYCKMLILHKGSCILNPFFAKHSVILFYFPSMVTLLISFFTNAIISNGRITKHLSPISDLQSDLISTYHWFNFLVNISNLNHWKCGFYRCQENISHLTFWKRLCIRIDFQVLSCNVEIKSLSLPSPVEIWMEIQIPSGKTSPTCIQNTFAPSPYTILIQLTYAFLISASAHLWYLQPHVQEQSLLH